MAQKQTSPFTLPEIEPGILPVFRLFMGGLWALFTVGLYSNRQDAVPNYFNFFSWGFTGLLFLYLSWRWLQRRVGAPYLPLALTLASIYPIIAEAFANVIRARQGLPEDSDAGTLIIWLILPLLLVSAQYRMRTMLFFTVGTSLLPLLLAWMARTSDLQLREYISQGIVRLFLFTMAGYIVVRLTTAQRLQRVELARKNAQLTHYAATLEQLTITRERNRLARDLHDTLAHTLSALNVQLNALDVLWDSNPEAAHQKLKQMQELTRSGLHESRQALQALRASPIDELGLTLALQQVAQTAAARAGAELTLTLPPELTSIPPDVEQHLYRIAEEALNNVVRHAQAQHVTLALQQSGAALTLLVRDDGGGFQASQTPPNGHYGIAGMKERAGLINGILQVESQPGKGTTVRLTIPLEAVAK
ncbi:MAG: sensor histidine kinase [Chloroflexota bacterium]